MKKAPFCILIFILWISACSNASPAEKNNPTVKAANSPEANINAEQNRELRNQIERIAFAAKGRVGVTATVLETGESVSLNGKERFPMQSVYKLPIGMAVLRQVDDGKIKLDDRVRVEKSDLVERKLRSPIRDKNPNGTELTVKELLRFAVSESDGTASDVLFKLVGGAEAVGEFLSEIKVDGINVLSLEKEIAQDWETQYRNSASPAAAVSLLRALHERRGLSAESQTLLLKFMTETPTGAKRLKSFLPASAVVAHKTGTSGSRNGITAATNDIGIITAPNGRHLAVAVFVSDSPADEATREEVIAKIAKAVWDEWSD